ncbi:hypothetical protein M408DRAFT_333927 [Serendipita vermifera MAFF 305830]|uniref:PNPLA domain-containing protein n=1 Tax=Serendipita vermifera MAFF 305830 TaxID=933852 RepID=A0A0C3A7E2_SERVB|nr:hypothetical protein M408DRAFT_333927 [Serendipita vermifera MAFF 305830]
MTKQSILASDGKGLCLLSLDAGGSRGISQLTILSHLMYRINNDIDSKPSERPCTIFDMIGGVGSGGFIAILLAVLGLTAEEASEEFANLSLNILDKQDIDAETRTNALRGYVNDLLAKYRIDQNSRLIDTNNRSKGCKLAVAISYKHNTGSICILRNYTSRQEKSLNLTITEAVLATLATPPLFASAQIIKDTVMFDYIGADLILNNPTQEVVAEAHEAFGAEENVACLLNLGSGHAGVFSTPEDSSMVELAKLLERLAMDGERKAESIGSQMGQLGLYYRFNVSHGLEINRVGKITMDPGVITQQTQAYLGKVHVSHQIEACTSALRLRTKVASLNQLRYLGGIQSISPQLPPLTKTFVMRKEPWNFIEKALLSERDIRDINGPRMLFVTGIGGCGKTQLMLRFMKEHKSRFIYQFFIDGSSEDRIRDDIVRNVRSLGTEHSRRTFEDCILFLSQPSQNGLSLLLYDNVDDPNLDLSSLLPHGDSCAIAITSRNYVLGELNPKAHLPLDIMSLEEATELLLHGSSPFKVVTDHIRKDIVALAEALGSLPIALQQACAYMRQTKCSARSYLSRLSKNKAKLLSQKIKYQVDMQSISTYAAFEMSFEKLPETSKKLLRLLSYFHWAGFPLELINQAADHSFLDYKETLVEHDNDFYVGRQCLKSIFLRDGEWDVMTLDEMILSLQNYSIVTLIQGVDTLLVQMHLLTHEWVQTCIQQSEKHEFECASIVLLALGARKDRTASTQYLASHVLHTAPLWNRLNVNNKTAFGCILYENGLYHKALQLQEAVVEELRRNPDTGDIKLSNTLRNLGLTFSALGQMNVAKELQEEVVNLRNKFLGECHPDTITASFNLASTYLGLGRLREAKEFQEEVLKLRKEILGEHHPDTISASHDLSNTYFHLGRLKEAEVLQEEVLKLRKEILGERHPDTISASHGLAVVYSRLGRLIEAEVFQEEVLKLRKEILGERHPDTIWALHELAIAYSDLGKLDEAEVLQKEVLKLWKEILGEQHPDTIMASSHLASTYFDLKRLNEAGMLQEEVLKLQKETFGERHPDTIRASSILANTYADLGRLNEAQWLQEEALRLSKETLGERHPRTIHASGSLARTYRKLGRLNEAKFLYEEAVKPRKKILGDHHPLTIRASNNLEWARHWLEDRGAASETTTALKVPPSAIPDSLLLSAIHRPWHEL